MKKYLILLLFSNVLLQAQDTVFYDRLNRKVSSTDSYNTYDVRTKIENTDNIKVITYSIIGYALSEIDYSDLDKKIRNGVHKTFWEDGKVKYICTYINEKKEGLLESFSKTGYRKREEYYTEDVMTKGRCFDSLGVEIAFYPYEQFPRFKGCKADLSKEKMENCFYEKFFGVLQENLVYPSEAKNKNITGKVWVYFTIDVDGSVTDAEIIQDIGAGCGDEVLRVMKLYPKLVPAQEDGRIVKVKYRLPINFTLN